MKIDEDTRRKYYEYLEKHRRFEMIDSAILENLSDVFGYYDNEVDLYARKPKSGDNTTRSFETDMVYLSKNLESALLIEETLGPTSNRKVKQMVDYANVTSESLKMMTNADKAPTYDVFIVFPDQYSSEMLEIFESKREEMGIPGKGFGVSIWEYPKSRTHLKCVGGTFSREASSYLKTKTTLKTRGIGTFRILKSAHHVFLLQFIVIRALEVGYGKTNDGIRFDRDMLLDCLKPYGIIKEERWREAIKIGVNVGWLEAVSMDQLTGTINYTKVSASSISRSKKLAANFFVAVEDEDDRKQAGLEGFGLTLAKDGATPIDDELDEDDSEEC